MQNQTGSGRLLSGALVALALMIAGCRSTGPEYQLEGDEVLIRFNEVDGTRLVDFIHLYQSLTDKVVHYKEADVEDVWIRQLGSCRVHRTDLDLYFGAVLRQNGLGLVHMGPERGGFWYVRRFEPKGEDDHPGVLKVVCRSVPPAELGLLSENPGMLVTTSYTTRHVPARQVVNRLQSYLIDTTGNIRVIENTDTLLLTGYADTLRDYLNLIAEIDNPPR